MQPHLLILQRNFCIYRLPDMLSSFHDPKTKELTLIFLIFVECGDSISYLPSMLILTRVLRHR